MYDFADFRSWLSRLSNQLTQKLRHPLYSILCISQADGNREISFSKKMASLIDL